MKKILSSVLISFSLLSIPVLGHTFTCQEYKTFASNKSAKDAPSWVKQSGLRPCKNPNESGNQFAKRILDDKYGQGNWPTGPNSEHNKIRKYGDRAFN